MRQMNDKKFIDTNILIYFHSITEPTKKIQPAPTDNPCYLQLTDLFIESIIQRTISTQFPVEIGVIKTCTITEVS